MDSLQRMSDRPLSSSSLSLSLGQMSGINHLGTTEEQHMCSHCSCAADAIRQHFRELNQPKAGSSTQKELGAQPSQQCQHQGSRKVGRRAGRRGELAPGDRPLPGGFSCSSTSPAKLGQRRCSGCGDLLKALNSHSL